jgi:hypothetical protein
MTDQQREERERLHRELYNTSRWKRLRLIQLANEPLCECCFHGHSLCLSGATADEKAAVTNYGISSVEAATLVDHRLPAAIFPELWWSMDNLQSLGSACGCHSRKTKRIDTIIKRQKRIDDVHNDLEDWDTDVSA